MELALLYGIWKLLRHDKFSKTHVLATLLIKSAKLFNGKKISCISGINKLLQKFKIFGRVFHTGLLATLR